MGPLDHMLKTDVPEEMYRDFVTMANITGKSNAEYLRDMIAEHLYGSIETLRSHTQHSMGRVRTDREPDL